MATKKAAAPIRAAKGALKKAAKAVSNKLSSRSQLSGAKARGGKPAAPAKTRAASASTRKIHGAGNNARAIAERLARAIPQATCELRFDDPFELLIATILSAQSTDKMVNSVMPTLLARYPDAHALASADESELEPIIKSTGFFRNKAKSIRGAARLLVERHGGQVPRTLDELVELPGVARKTANVVLGTAYRIASGFVVDTHVSRVAERLALTRETDPVHIERDLSGLFSQDQWVDLGHRLVLHGRYTCIARAPLCAGCPLSELCPSRIQEPGGSWEERARSEADRVASGFAKSAPERAPRSAATAP